MALKRFDSPESKVGPLSYLTLKPLTALKAKVWQYEISQATEQTMMTEISIIVTIVCAF